jgi:hypothetical protein
MTMATTQDRACSMSLMNKGDEAIKGLPLPLLAQSGRALRFETCLLLRPNRKPVVRFIDSAIRRPSLSYRRVTRSFSSGAHRRASLTNPPCSADRSCVICPTGCLAKFVSTRLNLNLIEKIEIDCQVVLLGPADPRPCEGGSLFKLCSPLNIVGFRALSICERV